MARFDITCCRSRGVIPRNRSESSGISSWVGDDGFVLGVGIDLLLTGCGVDGAASTQTAPIQKIMEVGERRDGHTWRANLHARAGGRVEHPLGKDGDHAGQDLDMDEPSAVPTEDPFDPNAPAEQRVPAILDDDQVPDMGRMDG